jgi:hypothetical protein
VFYFYPMYNEYYVICFDFFSTEKRNVLWVKVKENYINKSILCNIQYSTLKLRHISKLPEKMTLVMNFSKVNYFLKIFF